MEEEILLVHIMEILEDLEVEQDILDLPLLERVEQELLVKAMLVAMVLETMMVEEVEEQVLLEEMLRLT